MRIKHDKSQSYIQGTVDETTQVLAWIERAKQYEPSIMISNILIDECDEFETSYIVAGCNLTQRQEAFQATKKNN